MLTHLERLVVLPTVRGTDVGTILGWTLSHREREQLAARISAEPWHWVGQEPVGPAGPTVDGTPVGVGSDLPSAEGVGPADLGPRAAVLRTYAVAHGGSYTVLAGGLARVAPGHVVSSALGAAAKDVWVLSTQPDAPVEPWVPSDESAAGEVADAAPPGDRHLAAHRREPVLDGPLRRAGRGRQPRAARRRRPLGRLPPAAGLRGRSRARRAHLLAHAHRAGAARRSGTWCWTRAPAGTVARSVRRLAAAAAAVRDQLSTDTFGPLARIERALRDERSKTRGRTHGRDALDLGVVAGNTVTAGLRPALDKVLEGLLAIAGITAEGLVRDVGWQFLDAGRRIERAQHLVESLLATVVQRRPADVDAVVLESVLLAHESAITYRRRHQTGAGLAEVLELLLLDRTNPRSLAYQLDRLQESLALVPLAGRAPDQRDHLLSDVVDLLAEVDPVAVTAAVTEDGRRARLAETLESMLWRLHSAADEIERVHFVRLAPSRALEDPWDARDGGGE